MNTPTEAQRLNELRFILILKRRQERSCIIIAINVFATPLLTPVTLIFLL